MSKNDPRQDVPTVSDHEDSSGKKSARLRPDQLQTGSNLRNPTPEQKEALATTGIIPSFDTSERKSEVKASETDPRLVDAKRNPKGDDQGNRIYIDRNGYPVIANDNGGAPPRDVKLPIAFEALEGSGQDFEGASLRRIDAKTGNDVVLEPSGDWTMRTRGGTKLEWYDAKDKTHYKRNPENEQITVTNGVTGVIKIYDANGKVIRDSSRQADSKGTSGIDELERLAKQAGNSVQPMKLRMHVDSDGNQKLFVKVGDTEREVRLRGDPGSTRHLTRKELEKIIRQENTEHRIKHPGTRDPMELISVPYKDANGQQQRKFIIRLHDALYHAEFKE